MSDLPKGWLYTSLMDIVNLHDNKRIPLNQKQRLERKGSYPYYGANGKVDSINDFIFDGTYILLAEDGGYFDDPSRGVAYEVSGKFWVNNHAHILSPCNQIFIKFLTYCLNTINWMEYVSGSTRLKLTQEGMKRVIIPLAPLAEQKRIVTKLDSLFAHTRRARQELDHIPKLIERYKQAILSAAFRGDLTADWRKENNRPETQNLTSIGSIALSISYGSSAKSSPTGSIPVLRMGNIQDGKLDWNALVFTSNIEEIEKYKLLDGDVLFNRTNSPELVGKTAVYKNERIAIYAGYLIRIRCKPEIIPNYLNYCLNSPEGRNYCFQVKSDGVSQSNINAKKLAAFTFNLPSIEEQQEIIKRVEKYFQAINCLEQEYQKAIKFLDRLEQTTLAKAFRGELVPQDPNDEPASILLERIQKERESQKLPKKKQLSLFKQKT